MCGIVGFMILDGVPVDFVVLDVLVVVLVHCGSDRSGWHVVGDVGMVYICFVIIDLEIGDQFLYGDGGLVLVVNVEIYNYVELCESMNDVVFVTVFDCEIPLFLYCCYDLDYVDHLCGMYVIVFHDLVCGWLVLSCDFFGIKLLYYVETVRGLVFVFEFRTLVVVGMVVVAEHFNVRNELLQFQFFTGCKTLLVGVMWVLFGETLVVESGRIVGCWCFEVLFKGFLEEIEEGFVLAWLDVVLEDSVCFY